MEPIGYPDQSDTQLWITSIQLLGSHCLRTSVGLLCLYLVVDRSPNLDLYNSHTKLTRTCILKPIVIIKPSSRLISKQRNIRLPIGRSLPVDMPEQRFQNRIPKAFPLMVGMHGHICNMEIPTPVPDHPSHANRLWITRDILEGDVAAKPAARGNRGCLGGGFGRKPGNRAEIPISGD